MVILYTKLHHVSVMQESYSHAINAVKAIIVAVEDSAVWRVNMISAKLADLNTYGVHKFLFVYLCL